MHTLVILTSLPVGWLAGLTTAPPWGRLLTLTLVLWLTSLPLLAVQSGLGRPLGLIGGLLLGLVGAVSGIGLVEGAWWWLHPWAWSVRATLALSGTHANGVPLAPGDPIWHVSFWPPVLLTAAALPFLMGLGGRLELPFQNLVFQNPVFQNPVSKGVAYGRRPRNPAGVKPSPERSVFRVTGILASEGLKYRRTFVPYLSLGVPALLLLAFWGRRASASDIWQLWALLVLPFGAALLPAAAWLWEGDAWRVLRARAVRVAQLYLAKLAVLWVWTNASALLLGALLWAFRGQPNLLQPLVLHAAVSFFLLALHLYLALRFGPGVTLGAGAVSTLLALILGGTELGATLWPFVPWTWGWLPLVTGATLPFALLALGLGAVLSWLGALVAGRLEATTA